ncbi:unnamed protein product [Prunus armeniaca]
MKLGRDLESCCKNALILALLIGCRCTSFMDLRLETNKSLTLHVEVLFTRFAFTPVVEGQSSPLPCEPLTGQQVSFLWCASVPLLAMKILADLF